MYTETKRRAIFYMGVRQAGSLKPITLSNAIKGFDLACRARRLSVHTLTDYGRTLKKFLAHVGDAPVKEITSTQVAAFLASQPFSAKTVLNYHIGLSALWTWMIREGYAEKHIMKIVEKPRPQHVVVMPFSETEIKAIIGSVRRNEERDRAMIFILLDTGLRASELCGLSMDDIDLVNRRLKVLGKGNKERLLPISPRTASAVFRYISTNGSGRPFPLTRTSLAHLLQEIGKRAGLKDCHPHRFRHTFSIMYLRNGGDPYTLQEILGHTTMEMVKKYLALAQVDLDNAHKRFSPVEGMKL